MAGLRARADAGDGYAAVRLVDVLVEQGNVADLRARSDAGDGRAAAWLAYLVDAVA